MPRVHNLWHHPPAVSHASAAADPSPHSTAEDSTENESTARPRPASLSASDLVVSAHYHRPHPERPEAVRVVAARHDALIAATLAATTIRADSDDDASTDLDIRTTTPSVVAPRRTPRAVVEMTALPPARRVALSSLVTHATAHSPGQSTPSTSTTARAEASAAELFPSAARALPLFSDAHLTTATAITGAEESAGRRKRPPWLEAGVVASARPPTTALADGYIPPPLDPSALGSWTCSAHAPSWVSFSGTDGLVSPSMASETSLGRLYEGSISWECGALPHMNGLVVTHLPPPTALAE